MAINLSEIGNRNKTKQVDPREIFMALPHRNTNFEYPRDVQSEVWKQWYEQRNSKDCIIKMNTGSGKTVVALLILQSCLNEGKGPAVYVVPDPFLVKQVIEQAKQLGIAVASGASDMEFIRGKAILVINIYELVNGKSKFGMREYNNVKFSSVVIDDVHACLSTIQGQFKIFIRRDNEAYKKIANIFYDELKRQSESKIEDILLEQNPCGSMLIPFWAWQEHISEVLRIISEMKQNDRNMEFTVNLVQDSLKLCRGYISAEGVEIVPNCIPIHKIRSLDEATRRIYLSATLPDDSIFASDLNVDLESIKEIITPENANDIGERLIVVPKLIDSGMQDVDIRNYAVEMSKKINVVVLVPSYKCMKIWQELGGYAINSNNMDEGIKRVKESEKGLYIILNKYDGIDLPNGACRLLIIDGLPNIMGMNDKYEESVVAQSDRIMKERIQKIEQGMGRGVRSNSDYCIVILMGNELTDAIYSRKAYEYFSEATRAQYELSETICDNANGFNEIAELVERILLRDEEWVLLCKNNASKIKYNKKVNYNNLTVSNRKAYNFCEIGKIQEATRVMLAEANQIKDTKLKGYYEQQRAEYVNLYDKNAAQELMRSAKSKNKYLLNPIDGIQTSRSLDNVVINQTKGIMKYVIDRNMEDDNNKYILHMRNILDKLVFEKDSHEAFEEAIKEIMNALGFKACRPEKETGIGPDDFCIISEKECIVIECKNETKTDRISKHDCEQLLGSLNWFKQSYPTQYSAISVMIHNSNVYDKDGFPDEKTRIMTPNLLDKFKKNIMDFCTAFTRCDNYMQEEKLDGLLKNYSLLGKNIIESYTVEFKK